MMMKVKQFSAMAVELIFTAEDFGVVNRNGKSMAQLFAARVFCVIKFNKVSFNSTVISSYTMHFPATFICIQLIFNVLA